MSAGLFRKLLPGCSSGKGQRVFPEGGGSVSDLRICEVFSTASLGGLGPAG